VLQGVGQRGAETTSKDKMCLQVFYRAGEGRLLGMQMSPVRVKLLRNAISTLAGNRWVLVSISQRCLNAETLHGNLVVHASVPTPLAVCHTPVSAVFL